MKLHFLGICGTFMGSLAIIARELGHVVTGSDANVYPPMSTQLEAQGIEIMTGYSAAQLQPAPDLVIVGNAMARGNPAVEAMLDAGLNYTSGPQWLCEQVLTSRKVFAVSGTHGKTTTSSMLAWVLDQAGLQPGYLIGGVPFGLPASARLGKGKHFVIEADEYDSAFFDKRSKFVHYRPNTLIINNIEYDHADIFPDLAAIQRQFHHVVRTVPASGRIIVNAADANIEQTLRQGCWSPLERFGLSGEADWTATNIAADGSSFEVCYQGRSIAKLSWKLLGLHNVSNALATIAAARQAGVEPAQAIALLADFGGVKRRMELLATVAGVSVYDDFAHHPTAIETSLQGLRAKPGTGRIIAVIEPRSNTMRMGVHRGKLASSAAVADQVIWHQAGAEAAELDAEIAAFPAQRVLASIDAIIDDLLVIAQPGDTVVMMSNGGFGGIHQRLLAALQQRV